ncbi:MAG: oligoendopeptidase F [Spirochaetaceae bacterium]|jgi:oligoendopeptidase F|nr:oligoendopeptidase F [Spirochaetaceae bacterium]
MSNKKIPLRKDVQKEDRWDLSKLFTSDSQWEGELSVYEKQIEKIPGYKGTLAGSAETLGRYLDFARDLGVLEERLSHYAELRCCEDEGDAAARAMAQRFVILSSRAEALRSWAAPEIQSIPDAAMQKMLQDERLNEYRIYLAKLLRWKPHILSEAEERVIALQSEASSTVSDVFSVLTNVDFDFGMVRTAEGDMPLTQSTWSVFMENEDRALRESAWKGFYKQFSAHKTTLAALYAGQVKQDAIYARLRGFGSSREAALFGDDVQTEVYDNLVNTITKNLPVLHKYYALRRRILGLDKLAHWDVYVPLVKGVQRRATWEEAVTLVTDALSPLGAEYVDTLRSGLTGRWADRYENKGKRSGAFSAGGYTSDPYILMNYKEDSVRDIFTLAHEGGHSMHSWYSAHSNPFMQYSYTIFEAEVASTFNEELLFRHLLKNAPSKEFSAYIINKRIDDVLATLYRQTMFAEFEKTTHQIEESGEALTVNVIQDCYRSLLEKYFGEEMRLDELSSLEGLRIPHFYRAFYVYKYATGISASLALAKRVLEGGKAEKDAYFAFLKSGGSRFPIEALRVAGVDMASPAPVEEACAVFAGLVTSLEAAL